MKAQELRIGNYLEYQLEHCDWDLNTVDAEDIMYLSKKPTDHNYRTIKLNQQWLMELGFEKHEITKEGNQIWRKTNDEGFFDLEHIISYYFGKQMYSVRVEFVHELQNLYFAIFKKELTTKKC